MQFQGLKKQEAFTLIELLVVIAIIALLLAIIMPALNMAKEHARRLICASHLRGLGQILHTYADEHNGLIVDPLYGSDDGTGNPRINPVTTYLFSEADGNGDLKDDPPPPADPINVNLAPLWKQGLVAKSSIFYCPSAHPGDPFSYSAYGGEEKWPYPVFSNPDNPDRIRVSYSYIPQSARDKINVNGTQFPGTTNKLIQTASGKAMCLDTLQNMEWWSHKRNGYAGANLLYSDGSTRFCRGSEYLNGLIQDVNFNPMESGNEVLFRELIQELE